MKWSEAVLWNRVEHVFSQRELRVTNRNAIDSIECFQQGEKTVPLHAPVGDAAEPGRSPGDRQLERAHVKRN